MSFLMALVGFAAVIAVYSTIVSVLVEGIHKLFALRSAGMSEMLRAFYDQKLGSLQPDDTPAELGAPTIPTSEIASPQSKAFARQMTRRASSENLRPWYIRRWPLIGSILSSRTQKMSTLQFVERLADTPEGQALIGHNRAKLRKALTSAAYEFERMGEAQTDYFRSRAKMLSVIAGIAVAFFVNLDAITVYKELSNNATLSARLSTLAEVESFQSFERLQADATDSAENVQYLSSQVENLVTEFTDLGIPVGRKMFPHCDGYTISEDSDEPLPYFKDERCAQENQRDVNATWQQSFDEFVEEKYEVQPNANPNFGDWLHYRWTRIEAIIYNPQTFLMWLLGVLLAGGLLGLGAPFWFRTFARGAAIVAPMARATLAATASSEGQKHVTVKTSLDPKTTETVRHTQVVTPAALERAYLTVMGRGTEIDLEGEEFGLGVTRATPPEGRIIGTLPPERTPGGEQG